MFNRFSSSDNGIRQKFSGALGTSVSYDISIATHNINHLWASNAKTNGYIPSKRQDGKISHIKEPFSASVGAIHQLQHKICM
nr:hypothetical protein [Tanacetum cinerariifolium]